MRRSMRTSGARLKAAGDAVMPIHRLTLFVEGADLQAEPVINALFEAGCEDATVGRADGVQYIELDREAKSFSQAVFSAVQDVEKVEGVQITRGLLTGRADPRTRSATRATSAIRTRRPRPRSAG